MNNTASRLLGMIAVVTALVVVAFTERLNLVAQSTPRAEKTTGYAPVNGLNMYYEIKGEGQPAVFIHPIVSQCALISNLTSNRRWVSMDLQGHGRTADINRPMSCEQHADDIAALLKHLKIEAADFFGDSFGGAIAVTMALRHPQLVRRIAVYGSPLAPFPKEIGSFISADSDQVKWEREEYQKVAPDPRKWPTLFEKVLNCGIHWKGISSEELASIKAPILLMCGDHDLIPVERCVELSRQIPNSQLAVIPDASHFVLFSEPEKLLPTIATFFDAPKPTTPLSTMKTGYYPGITR